MTSLEDGTYCPLMHVDLVFLLTASVCNWPLLTLINGTSMARSRLAKPGRSRRLLRLVSPVLLSNSTPQPGAQ
jgi:hypothetical protein